MLLTSILREARQLAVSKDFPSHAGRVGHPRDSRTFQTAAQRRRKSYGAYQHLNTQYTDEVRYWLVGTAQARFNSFKKEVKSGIHDYDDTWGTG